LHHRDVLLRVIREGRATDWREVQEALSGELESDDTRRSALEAAIAEIVVGRQLGSETYTARATALAILDAKAPNRSSSIGGEE